MERDLTHQQQVDRGLALDPEPVQCRAEAAGGIIRHKVSIIAANPGQEDTVDRGGGGVI